MNYLQEIIEELILGNPELSNIAIAKILSPDGSYTRLDNLRKKTGKIRKAIKLRYVDIPIREAESPYICEDLTTNEMSKTLVIGDIHCPFDLDGYLDFCKDVYVKNKCNKVIFIGDEMDWQSISFHEHNPNMPSPHDELMYAKQRLQRWYKEFPEAIVIKGNHQLIARKVKAAGLPSDILKPLNELLGVPNWKFLNEYEEDGILYTHGDRVTRNTIKMKALKEQKSIIVGHWHSICMIEYITQKLFTAFVGCGIDYISEAFDYTRGSANVPVISCMIVDNGEPILKVMK